MPRQVRIEYPGAIYHGMARGNRREAIVLDDEDRDRFRKLLEDLVQQIGWEVFAWVLMTNHLPCRRRLRRPRRTNIERR